MVCCCLQVEEPRLASESRFLRHSGFVCYKFLAAVYFVFWCAWWQIQEDYDEHLFFTYWAFYVTTFYFCVSTATAIWRVGSDSLVPNMADHPLPSHGRFAHESQRGGISCCGQFLLGIQLCAWNIACVAPLVVVVIFWISLYSGGKLSTTDVNAHILIAIIMILDQLLIATEYRFRHVVVSQAAGIIYIAFNVTWYHMAAKDERIIYDVLDWDDSPVRAAILTTVIIFVLAPAFSLLHKAVYRLRERIYRRKVRKELASLPISRTEVQTGVAPRAQRPRPTAKLARDTSKMDPKYVRSGVLYV